MPVKLIYEPILLGSTDHYDGHGETLLPGELYVGPAFIVGNKPLENAKRGDVTHKPRIQNVSINKFTCAIEAYDCNSLHINDVHISECPDGITLDGCWDFTIGEMVSILKTERGMTITGSQERYSNPSFLTNVRIENYSEYAISIQRAGNIIASACKFHAKQGQIPTKATIEADAYNCLQFNSCLFMFHRKHFSDANPNKLQINNPITDNADSLIVNGQRIAKNVLLNERRRKS